MKLTQRGELSKLSKEQLLDYIGVMSKNWWTLQNNWMANTEKKYGSDVALEFDCLVCAKYGTVELHRFKKLFNLGDDMEALKKWLIFSFLMNGEDFEIEFVEDTPKRLYWRCTRCPIQLRRRKEGLPELPCKAVWVSDADTFGKAANPKIKSVHYYAPPDPHTEDNWCGCIWEMED